jgi:hypothetical protein
MSRRKHVCGEYVRQSYVWSKKCPSKKCRGTNTLTAINAEYRVFHFYAEFHCAECQCAEWHCSECHHAECHYSEWHYAEWHYAEYQYAECHYSEWHYAEWHYAEEHAIYLSIRLSVCLSVYLFRNTKKRVFNI